MNTEFCMAGPHGRCGWGTLLSQYSERRPPRAPAACAATANCCVVAEVAGTVITQQLQASPTRPCALDKRPSNKTEKRK